MKFIKTFNVFESVPPTTNEHDLQNQRISTRIFIFLVFLSLTILLLYNSLVNITQTVSEKTPSFEEYSNLYSKYSEMLTCPCTKISINYEEFISIEYTLHQVCSSIFVTQRWFDFLRSSQNYASYWSDDFRATGVTPFQALNVFCELNQKTVSNSLSEFYSKQYVTGITTPSDIFQSQAQIQIDQFVSSAEQNFLFSLTMIRGTTQGNVLYTAQQTNYNLLGQSDNNEVYVYPRIYDCSCDVSSTCAKQIPLYAYSDNETETSVPYLYVGCYMIDSLLRSSLEFFYNQTYIIELESYFKYASPMNATALNSSFPSRYFINSTIEQLLNQLMVEQWHTSIEYEKYYNQCQPSQCIYTQASKNSVIYIITTLFGLSGGLVTILKLIIPRLVKFVRKKRETSETNTGRRIKY